MIRRRIGKLLVSSLEFAERLPLVGKSVADVSQIIGHRFFESGAYGAYLLKKRKPAEAETRFRKALDICVSNAEAIAGLTEALADQGRFREIIEELIWLAKRIPDSNVVKCLPFPVQSIKLLLNDPSLMDEMRQHVARNPGAVSATLLLAFSEAECGNIAQSTQLFDTLAAEFFQGKEDPAAPKAKPKFLILGQNKAATTALFGHLRSHPLMVSPLRKEPNFWSRNYHYGSAWYESQFPRLSLESRKFTGESSTSYLLHATAPSRVHRKLPEVKLIVLLRDPVSRAYSQYCMIRKGNDPNKGFSEVAHQIMEEHSSCPIDDALISKKGDRYVFTNSISLPGLKRWLEYFPAEQLLVLHQEDFLSDISGVLDRVCDFLNVPHFTSTSPKMLHTGRYPPLDDTLKEELKAWYAQHEKALKSFLATLPGYRR